MKMSHFQKRMSMLSLLKVEKQKSNLNLKKESSSNIKNQMNSINRDIQKEESKKFQIHTKRGGQINWTS